VDDPERAGAASHGLRYSAELVGPSTPELEGDHGRRWAQHVFQLPCHQDLSDEDMEWMINDLHEIFAGQE
jgi:dTDP-4-amino-4,6-dideoxygalactose transaminase